MNNIRVAQSIAGKIASDQIDSLGRVALSVQGGYTLLNYTREAMYSKSMTPTEEACRGLVVRDDARIMALPMPKFYNLGEPRCPPLPDEPYTVWEKIDGSFTAFWHDDGEWHCTTRGSFQNEYIEFALEWWNGNVDANRIPAYWTIMAEVCIDNDTNPRAAYKPEGLYLVAIRDRYSGKDVGLLASHFDLFRLLAPRRFDTTVDTLLDWKQSNEGTEGWVVRFESGFRVKVKTAWYLRLFRAVRSLTPKNIRELMIDAGEDWIGTFPDDLQPEAVAIQEAIEAKFHDLLSEVYQAYSKLAGIETRKDYAQRVLLEHPDISHWLFKLRDNRFDEQELLKAVPL